MSTQFHQLLQGYREMTVRYDPEQEAIWTYFKPSSRPCFTPTILEESLFIQKAVIDYFKSNEAKRFPVRYMVLASLTPGVFNLGGDLNLFIDLIANKNRARLLEYATGCIDICYLNAVALNLPLTTITLVEGSALGGGLESAMSSNMLIAEEHAKMGFPEIRFNLFPGMGAYSFIARKAGMQTAEEILRSGKIYTARDMYDLKIVNTLAERGKGYQAVDAFIKKHQRIFNGMRAIFEVRQFYNPITYQELMGITKIWVDAALRISAKDIRIMEKLVQAQNRGAFDSQSNQGKVHLLRAKQDRRFDQREAAFPMMDSAGKTIPYDRRKMNRRASDQK